MSSGSFYLLETRTGKRAQKLFDLSFSFAQVIDQQSTHRRHKIRKVYMVKFWEIREVLKYIVLKKWSNYQCDKFEAHDRENVQQIVLEILDVKTRDFSINRVCRKFLNWQSHIADSSHQHFSFLPIILLPFPGCKQFHIL